MMTMNPANQDVLGRYEELTHDQLEDLIARSLDRFQLWRVTSMSERAAKLKAAADQLRQQRDELARLMVEEMGKPITQAGDEIDKCAWVCEYYADHGEEFLSPEPVETEATSTCVRFDPLGPVLAIMPWNFPFWQVLRFAAPALMAGNTCLLKHASNVTGCATAIERIFREAGFPPGCFTTLLIRSGQVADVIADPRVRAVTLTGSDAAGRAVAEAAGRHLKKCVLELGGSDPFIVLADADIETAARQAAIARTLNSGQSCIAAKRFLVEQSVAEQFTDALVREMEELRIGDPLEEETELGPLARGDLRDELDDQVQLSIAAGAELRLGGSPIEGSGFFYPATVLANVAPGMPAFDEELFGPVAAVIPVQDADEAVELANRSSFGLGASIWTSDTENAAEMAERLEAGAVFVNEIVKSDPRVPFGGVKESGFGRELSHFGIREFVNIKTVWIG